MVEYEANKKANTFKDRRFGEDDPGLSLEEKMMMRFQRERQRKSRKSMAGLFHLNDDNADQDEDLLLTHRGKALNEVLFQDDFNEAVGGNSDDDEDDGQLDARMVKVSDMTTTFLWSLISSCYRNHHHPHVCWLAFPSVTESSFRWWRSIPWWWWW